MIVISNKEVVIRIKQVVFCLFLISCSLLLFTLVAPLRAYAANPPTLSEGSLAISPFLIETKVAPGKEHADSITVFNVTDDPLPITISINDFVPSGDGSVRFLDTTELAHPSFSLASWITITDQPTFTIPPRGETKVTFTISVPVDAEPGTHYGGLLFSTTEKKLDAAGSTIVKKIGALILVATGKTNASGSIKQFSSSKKFYTNPKITLTSSFTNTGNIHVSPKGQIAMRNMFGKLVGESYANENAQFVLPGQTRKFESGLQKSWMFGRYTATLTYYFGNPKLEANSTLTFWVFPLKKVGFSLLLLLILYATIKFYKAWIIEQSRKKL